MPVTADGANPPPHRLPLGAVRFLADRTAVLVVGLVTGFAVGAAFAPAPDAAAAASANRTARPVSAGASPAAVMPDARAVQRVKASGVVRIGVFGDSFGVGIWDALYRLMPREQGFDVLRFAREGVGFTRHRGTEAAATVRDGLTATPVDIAVICMGVNDAKPMYDGRLYPFMSDGWQTIVGDRIDRFLAIARSTGAAVYWLGLPAMRDPALDARVRMLNDFYAMRMKALGVPFLPTRELSVDRSGRYAAHLADGEGTQRLMRTGDGIHMIGIGYQRIAGPLVGTLRAEAARLHAAVNPSPRMPVK